MKRIALSALCYFLIVFGGGFALGAVRVTWIEPLLGPTAAVACEMPLLVAAMFVAARWLPQRLGMPANAGRLAAMGLGALLLQQIADFTLGVYLRKITLAQQASYLATPAGLIYLAGLAMFAAMPVLVNFYGPPRSAP